MLRQFDLKTKPSSKKLHSSDENKKLAKRTGIISALREEQDTLVALMPNSVTEERAMRTYTSGTLWGHDVVCVLSRVGKVAEAQHLNVGDIVIADELVQHNMNTSPLFPRYEIPLLKQTRFASARSGNGRRGCCPGVL